MGNSLKFTLARASLLTICIVSSIVAILWLVLPFGWQFSGSFRANDYSNVWMHVHDDFRLFISQVSAWPARAGEMHSTLIGFYQYPIVAIILLNTFISILMLRVSDKNKSAWILSISLSTGAWYFAYTYIIRAHLLVDVGWIGTVLDYVTAMCFALSLFYFSKFFSYYPDKLDFEATHLSTIKFALPKTATKFALPKTNRLSRLRAWIEHINEAVDRKARQSKIPFIRYLGNYKREDDDAFLAFFDSIYFLFICALVATSSLFFWQLIDWPTVILGSQSVENFNLFRGLSSGPPLILIISIGFTTFIKLIAQYHLGSEEGRRKIEWIYLYAWVVGILFVMAPFLIIGLDIAVTESLLNPFPGPIFPVFIFYLVPNLVVIGFLLCLLLSIFYRGTIDPKLLIRKSTVYTLIALSMTAIFIAVEGAITSQSVVRLGMPTQTGAVVAGTLTALIFGPIRNRVEDGIHRFVDGILPASALAEGTRYEAVVVFNDLSGFTKMTEEDEAKALTAASLFHKEGKKAAEGQKGRVVKTIGDAVLMEFLSVDNAIRAINQLHEKYHRACDVMDLPQMPIHSGVHLGMVVKAPDGDIYGNAVNIAARLEGVAGPDEIVLSEAAESKLQTESFSLEAIGEQLLKNVNEPVVCFKVT